MRSLMLAGLLLAVGASGAAAQSLADVARQERARRDALAEREAAGGETKVYTRSDLRAAGRLTTTVRPPVTAATAPTAATPTGDAEPPAEAAAADGTEQAPAGEEEWRARIAAAEQQLARARMMAQALQNRVDGLWAEFTGRDDPAQRTMLEQDRQAAMSELENTNAEIAELTQQIADIREEARRANVPPGWLR